MVGDGFVMELADILVLEASAEKRGGSNPSGATNAERKIKNGD